jgi:hypothetical protein
MMKITRLCVLVLLYGSLYHGPLLGQAAGEDRGVGPDPVLSIAEKTLDAIRHKDTGFLARMAEPTGVFIGVDAPRMSAARFRKDLAEKRGVYCVIFDASCLANKNEASKSLRETLEQAPVTMSFSKIGAASQDRAVLIKKAGSPGENLFTLIFRCGKHNCMLEQIEYW